MGDGQSVFERRVWGANFAALSSDDGCCVLCIMYAPPIELGELNQWWADPGPTPVGPQVGGPRSLTGSGGQTRSAESPISDLHRSRI